MIQVTLYYKDEALWRLRVEGHAGFAEHGEDIVCSAVSVLVLNTINSIEALTNESLSLDAVDSTKGIIDCRFPKRKQGNTNPEATLLIESMLMGLRSIQQMYGEYISIKQL